MDEIKVNPGIIDLQPYKPGKPISELQRELHIDKVVKLASNESILPISDKVKQALQHAIGDIHRYPDDGFALKNKLSSNLGVLPTQLTLGNGSDELFNMLLKVFCDVTSEVIVSQYAFAAYKIAVKACGSQVVEVPAINLAHDLEGFVKAINTRTKLIFIANPNNPTGTWNTKRELISFLEQVPSQVVVVVDQAYFEYMIQAEYPDPTKWLARFPNLVITRTFSKAYSLAGLRLGYCISTENIADYLNRVRLPFNVNVLAQVAALAILDDFGHLQSNLKQTVEGIAKWKEALDNLKLEYVPPIANFILVKIGEKAATIYDRMLHKGVIVRPLQPYHLNEYLRITVGSHEENDIAIAVFKQVLEEDS